jgi:transcription-repair coupling factor (superfamily II helicase)
VANAPASLFPLTVHLRGTEEITALFVSLKSKGVAAVHGAPRACEPVVAAITQSGPAGSTPGQLLVVTADPEQAATWVDEIRYWVSPQTSVLPFPALEALPYERTQPEPTIVQQRQAVLDVLSRGGAAIIVAPIRSLLQPLQDPRTYKTLVRRLEVQGRLAVAAEIQSWESMGYAGVKVVRSPGEYCRRGGLLDIFPADADWPVRIELIGSEIDSLRQFDPATQRSIGPIAVATIGPVHPFVLPAGPGIVEELRKADCAKCLPHIRTQWDEELGLLERGQLFDGIEFYTPYLARPAASLLSYLAGSATLFIDDPGALRDKARELVDQAVELSAELVGRGEIPSGLLFPLLDTASLEEEMEALPRVEWQPRRLPGSIDLGAGNAFRMAPTYAGSLKRFMQDCDEMRKQQERVVIVSLQEQRLAELLREADIPVLEQASLSTLPERGTITTVPGQVPEGWTAPNAHLVIFTDAEVAGWVRPRAAARFHREPDASFALDFSPGDFVVHIEHGIGRYEGVVRMGSGRAEREYLDLQYAGTDRLYVPTDQLDRITKYRGMGEETPALSRLGTQEWTRAKAKVRESVEVIARELLDLYRFREKAGGHGFAPDGHWQRELEAAFPFEETVDQFQAIVDVKEDMERARPMDRLVCGDVGYGKTEVALRAAFKAVMDGMQVAVLVPTTILAQQHFNTFRERMQTFPVRIGVLSRFHSKAEQQKVVEGIKAGTIDIAIGTHRLLQKDVQFAKLGLLVIDEEQRFGVKHKEQLKQMRRDVDVLTLSATPIPRSLHMGLMQVRDLSVIATAPEGRLPIKTFLEPFDEHHIRDAILREIDRGGQVYFVHNRVQTIEAISERLRYLVPQARIAVAHGQMPDADLERIMFDFADKRFDILVCSTIIENGLDIANVNTMIVNDAPQFGLSQLYQLRGRIGRGAKRGYAYLLYNSNVPISRTAERRLKAIFESTELGAGFQIALKDLEIRGAGTILGSAQHGHMAAVGFQLYCDMLAEAIDRQRGGDEPARAERAAPSISLQIDAYIPADYVDDENQRLRLYQRLAALASVDAVNDLATELRDRFGPLPDPVQAVLATVRIRIKAALLDISSIVIDPTSLVIRGTQMTNYDRADLYGRFGMAARIDRGVVRVPTSKLSPNKASDVEAIMDKALELAHLVTGISIPTTATPREPVPARRQFPS